MRALLIAIACLLVGHGVAAAQIAAPAKRTVQLTRMGSSMEGADLDTRFQFGLACVTDSSLRLRNASSRFDDPELKRVFREVMVNSGTPVPSEGGRDLFSGPGGSGDLQIGAMIRSLRLQTCVKTRFSDTEGSARIEVEWQVYSSEEGKVVTKIATAGSYSTSGSDDRR